MAPPFLCPSPTQDNSTMLIEAARGGHTAIVCLLLKQAMGLPTPLSVPTLPHPPTLPHTHTTHTPPSLQQQALVQASQVGLIEGMTHALRHQALPPRNIPRKAVGPHHQVSCHGYSYSDWLQCLLCVSASPVITHTSKGCCSQEVDVIGQWVGHTYSVHVCYVRTVYVRTYFM